MGKRAFTAAALFASIALSTIEANAQPKPSDVARAVELFEHAKQRLDAGAVAEACGMFVESYRIDPQVGTLLNSALCHERQGRTASAWAEFTTVVSLATRAGQAKRADFARRHAVALEPKLPHVLFDLRDADHSVAIAIDGEPIGAESVRNGPLPVDPGSHVIVVSAAHKKPWRSEIVVPGGPETTRVVVPALDDAAPEVSSTAAPAGAKTSDAWARREARSPDDPLRIAAWGTGIGAGVALGVGLIFGGLSLSAKSDADAGCEGSTCRTPEALDANERAFGFATVSTIGFVSAAALAATSIVLFVVSRPTKPVPTTASMIRFAF